MDDLFWIFFAVVGVFVSLAGKAMKQQQGRAGRSQEAPKWPGPVAGPRPGQGPTWAPPPASRQPTPSWPPKAQQPAKPLEPMKREAPKTLVSGDVFTRSLDQEGYGTEGIGTEGQGVEGPGVGEGVEDEMNRFSRESEQMERRQLSELTDDLVRPEQNAYAIRVETVDEAGLQGALSDPAGLSRAIVLAEVLGKPKALRGRRGFQRV
ncbi:MAG TPA: hypothetical protein VNT75_08140 [Symbiobacteriaceae bacterium]|nr:hypothetical protein [Symbiobacteriaceae bacterium]